MATEIRMPALGQVSDELLILRWLKNEGDLVKLGEPLLEVETDKATLEVEAAAAGTLLRIAHFEGETVEVGTVIAYVGKAGEILSTAPVKPVEAPGAAPAQPAPQHIVAHPGKVLATPVARDLARRNNIDLVQVRGTGPDGLIETRDVRALVEQVEHGAELPVPRHRQVIAQRLVQSVATMPQIRLTMSANMERARDLIKIQRAGLHELTYTHLILRAAAQALRAHPLLNRVWLHDGPRYRQYTRCDVGLAIASEDNLLVATIAEPDQAALPALVRQVHDAVERGRRGALSQVDMNPAAMTISNLGMYGVDDFQAIVDPAQTAILAVGRVADQVVVIDGGIRVAPLMHMSLTVDHRVADGALAARFLKTLCEALENMDA